MTRQFNTPALGREIAAAIAEREALYGEPARIVQFGDYQDAERMKP